MAQLRRSWPFSQSRACGATWRPAAAPGWWEGLGGTSWGFYSEGAHVGHAWCICVLGLLQITKTGWLKTTEVYPPTALEAGSPKPKCWQSVPSGGPVGKSVPCLPPGSVQHLLACRRITPISLHYCSLSVCVSLFSFHLGTPAIGLGPTPFPMASSQLIIPISK